MKTKVFLRNLLSFGRVPDGRSDTLLEALARPFRIDLKLFLSRGTAARHRGQTISLFVSSSRNRLVNVLLQLGHVTGTCVLLNRSIIESFR